MALQDCHAFGDLDEAFFRDRAKEVFEKMEGEENIAFSIVAVETKTQCMDAADAIDPDDRHAFIENCMGAETSVSLTSGGQEFIIIRADRAFLQQGPAALRGLLAHELMHTVQRESGVEQAIEDAAKDYQDAMVDRLAESGMDEDEISRFIYTVFQTAIFALKDLEANTALIDQSFTDDLVAYYHHMLGLDEFCPAPDFHNGEASLESVENAVTFELGLLPSWLPFVVKEPDTVSEIRERLEECYEPNIPDVAEYVQGLEDLYRDVYRDDRDAFRHRFFVQVVERSLELIREKLDQ